MHIFKFSPSASPLCFAALLLRRKHRQRDGALLLQPRTVPPGPSLGGLAEGCFGRDTAGAAGWLAGLAHSRGLAGSPVPLRPGPGHGREWGASPARQVDPH